jgi:ABC-type dipeptide/oligopeptide/nickel transport system permease subunit
MVGLVLVGILVVVAIAAPVLAPYHPTEDVDLTAHLKRPCLAHPFGQDEFGRDVLSRVIFGSRISLSVGILVEGISLVIGMTVGLVAGYYGGVVDDVFMRVTDIMFAFPSLLFAIGIMATLGPGLYNVFIALGLVGWPGLARLVRGQVLSLREKEFVEAARCLGAPGLRIMLRHLVPNCLGPVTVWVTLGIPEAIMAEASLSFLGLGAQPPTPSWGAMIYAALAYVRTEPWLAFFPGLAILITVLGFNLLGDGLRDALDPRLKT